MKGTPMKKHHGRPDRRTTETVFPAGLAVLLLILAAVSPALAQEPGLGPRLEIVGTGDSQELLRAVAKEYVRLRPGSVVLVPESIGSSGGIKSVIQGKAALARASRPLNESERAAGLAEVPFAWTAVVLAANPSVSGVSGLSCEQVSAVYSGRLADWAKAGGKAGKIYPVHRNPGDSLRSVVEAGIPGLKEIKEPVAATAYSTPELVDMLKRHKGAVGYPPASMLAGSGLRVLSLDGVPPTAKNVRSGAYPLRLTLTLVHAGELSEEAKRFVDFLLGPEGRAIVARHGAVPIDPAR
jgi:phosphate transport system substrate-binding protein